ncbi:MAG: hypothetical protein HQL99_03255 [Magnetococcales bacterium]|nr:hypothetical protein [Magnetococcales bacterium]
MSSSPENPSEIPNAPSIPSATLPAGKMSSSPENPSEIPMVPAPLPAGKVLLGVKLPDSCMVYRVVADLQSVAVGDQLLVQRADGEVIAMVRHVFELPSEPHPGPIRKVIRKLNDKDLRQQTVRAELEHKAHRLCREHIRALKLPMKLSKVEYPIGGGKAIIHFTSEARIDFRDLVRVLSNELRVRVEMRHVGVRDESKLLCGLGPCGKTLCCSQFLTRFHPVSVRMAKNQDLSLTPEGISGVCGRLMCCLAYENDAYLALRKNMPKVKAKVTLVDGREGVVRGVYPLLNRVELQFADGLTDQFDLDKLAGDGVAPVVEGAAEEEGVKSAPEIRPVARPVAPVAGGSAGRNLVGNKPAARERGQSRASPSASRGQRDDSASRGQRDDAASRGQRDDSAARGQRDGGGKGPSQPSNARLVVEKEPLPPVEPSLLSSPHASRLEEGEELSVESGEGGAEGAQKRRSSRRRRRGSRSGVPGESVAGVTPDGGREAVAGVAESRVDGAVVPPAEGGEEGVRGPRAPGSGRRRRRRGPRRAGEGGGGGESAGSASGGAGGEA